MNKVNFSHMHYSSRTQFSSQSNFFLLNPVKRFRASKPQPMFSRILKAVEYQKRLREKYRLAWRVYYFLVSPPPLSSQLGPAAKRLESLMSTYFELVCSARIRTREDAFDALDVQSIRFTLSKIDKLFEDACRKLNQATWLQFNEGRIKALEDEILDKHLVNLICDH